jgi:hypothetical protein
MFLGLILAKANRNSMGRLKNDHQKEYWSEKWFSSEKDTQRKIINYV